MRTEQDYKILVKGYSLSASLLNEVFPKLYSTLRDGMTRLDLKDASFADIVRNLKIDYINKNDEEEAKEARTVVFQEGKRKSVYAMLYDPSDDYALSFMRKDIKMFGSKQIMCMIYPISSEKIKENKTALAFKIAKVDDKNHILSIKNYYMGFADDFLVIVKIDPNNPEKAKPIYEIEKSMIKTIFKDLSQEF